MASTLSLASHKDLSHTRYAIRLSNGKRLVLFRLPLIEPTKTISLATQQQKTNEASGWSYFAMEAECPHAGGPMGDAHIDIEDSSYVASCPWHAYDFNVQTGESSYGVKACTYPVIIKDGHLTLRIADMDGLTLSDMAPISETVKFKHGPRNGRLPSVAPKSRGSLQSGGSLSECCAQILNTPDPELKIELTTQLFSRFATSESTPNPMPLGAGTISPPDTPARSNLQELKPWGMPSSGRGGTLKSRIAMLHALANIEQWAIDLALDICIRFAAFTTTSSPSHALPRTFFHDWLKVANDEAKHFSLLRARLEELGSHFGALPVHHGLWESAVLTAGDLRARISIIALVHEARGLDVNPMTIAKFRKAEDEESAAVLDIIHSDEITHVTTGHRWLSWICEMEGTDSVEVFRGNVRRYFKGAVKGPFNEEAREQAGLDGRYYEGLGRGTERHVIAGG